MIKHFKKIISIFLIITILPIYSFSDDINEENLDTLNTLQVNSNTNSINLNSKYGIVFDRTSKTILFEKNAYDKTAMASTTKIMTAILAIENAKLTDITKISKKAANTSGSTLGINANSEMTLESLLYGLLLRSGNDCAVAIAEHISGSTENFANLMNVKAKELNLKNTNFVTPHGLDATNHYTTTYDLALLTDYALNNETFYKIVGTNRAQISLGNSTKSINNTNELLNRIDGVYGVKTGFTADAGRCLVSACKRNNFDIIVIVLGAGTKSQRTTDSINLINYTYKNFEMYNFEELINSSFKSFIENYYNEIIINKAVDNPIFELKKINFLLPIDKKDIDNFKISTYTLNYIDSPISSNFKIGVLQLYVNNMPVLSVDITIKNAISKRTTIQYFIYLLKNITI